MYQSIFDQPLGIGGKHRRFRSRSLGYEAGSGAHVPKGGAAILMTKTEKKGAQ